MFTYYVICSHMQVYVHICRYMFTYCSHMFTLVIFTYMFTSLVISRSVSSFRILYVELNLVEPKFQARKLSVCQLTCACWNAISTVARLACAPVWTHLVSAYTIGMAVICLCCTLVIVWDIIVIISTTKIHTKLPVVLSEGWRFYLVEQFRHDNIRLVFKKKITIFVSPENEVQSKLMSWKEIYKSK